MSEEKPLTSNIESDQTDSTGSSTVDDDGNEGYVDYENVNNDSPPVKQRSGFIAAVAWLAILFALGSAFASYYLWNQLSRVEHGQQQAINSLREDSTQVMKQLHQETDRAGQNIDPLTPLDNRLSQVEQQLGQMGDGNEVQQQTNQDLLAADRVFETKLQKIQLGQEEIRIVLDGLRQRFGGNQETWQLAEVQFLLRIANQHLQLTRDSTTATTALIAADEQLHALGNPAYLPVREQLAKEIAELKVLPQPDTAGIAMAITGLVLQVRDLSVKGANYRPSGRTGSDSELSDTGDTHDWRELPGILWSSIKELVQVHRQDEPIGAMLAPQEQYFIYQNLQLKFEAARVAVLQQDVENFRASLLTAQGWIREYFDVDTALAKEMNNRIQQLLDINIRPDLPDISQSLRMLRQIIALSPPDIAISRGHPSVTDSGVQMQ